MAFKASRMQTCTASQLLLQVQALVAGLMLGLLSSAKYDEISEGLRKIDQRLHMYSTVQVRETVEETYTKQNI
jgi:hypothetical protein